MSRRNDMDRARALELLDLTPGSTPEQMKQAYRDLAKVWHPDRFPNDDRLRKKAGDRLASINEAYAFLQQHPTESPRVRTAGRARDAEPKTATPGGTPPPRTTGASDRKQAPPSPAPQPSEEEVASRAKVRSLLDAAVAAYTEIISPAQKRRGAFRVIVVFGSIGVGAWLFSALDFRGNDISIILKFLCVAIGFIAISLTSDSDKKERDAVFRPLIVREVHCRSCGKGVVREAMLANAKGDGGWRTNRILLNIAHRAESILRDARCPECRSRW